MATTNATISISSDIMSYTTTINKTMVMKKLGTCTGLDETTGLSTKKFTATTAVEIVGNAEGTADKASKVYIRNTGSDKAQHFKITLADTTDDTEEIGRLYGGDWMLFPWLATDNNEDIMVQPSTSEKMTLEYMIFHE